MNTGIVSINLSDSLDDRCKNCFLKTYQQLFEKFNVTLHQRQIFLDFYQDTIIRCNPSSTPLIQTELNRVFCQIIDTVDPFSEEKILSNSVALKLYSKWKPKVLASDNPFDLSLRLAIAGNIMDYGANNQFNIHETINRVLNTPFSIDHSALLKNSIVNANRILYLGDNAGEIVFDKLFIETIRHHEVFYAVRGAPILNDVTMTDTRAVRMDEVADVISNGFNAPSTVLEKCSKDFLEIYDSADLIISKGQGNYEGLMNVTDSRIFFLLTVKCDVIAEKLRVKKGDFIVYHHTQEHR